MASGARETTNGEPFGYPPGFNIRGSKFAGARLRGARLHGVGMEEVDFSGADLVGADLSGSDLSSANLSGAMLEDADFRGCRMRFAQLDAAILERADLRGADLWGADLSRAVLVGADLRDAQLHEAVFRDADLTNADLRGASASMTNLNGCRLDGADLREIDLHRADMRSARLRGARLEGVSLADCRLEGIHVADAVFERTRLTRHQLGRVVGEEAGREFDLAARGYLALERNFSTLSDSEGSRWAYLRRRRVQKRARFEAAAADWGAGRTLRALGAFLNAAADELAELLCNYGESVGRTIASLIILAVAFGFLYTITGAAVHVDSSGRTSATSDPVEIAVFTVSAMVANAPSGGLQPAGAWVYGLIGVEALLGVTLTGLLGFVLGNRIRR